MQLHPYRFTLLKFGTLGFSHWVYRGTRDPKPLVSRAIMVDCTLHGIGHVGTLQSREGEHKDI